METKYVKNIWSVEWYLENILNVSRNIPREKNKNRTGEDRLESDQSWQMLTMEENIRETYLKTVQKYFTSKNINSVWYLKILGTGWDKLESDQSWQMLTMDGASNDWSSDEALHFNQGLKQFKVLTKSIQIFYQKSASKNIVCTMQALYQAI